MSPLVWVLIVVVAAAVIVVVVARTRRANDGVDSFRRQIDALSPEARRPVVDQVQNHADRQSADTDIDADAGGDAGGDEPDDEDGERGT